MAAGDQKQEEGIGQVGGQAGGDRVTLQVIDGDQRPAERQGHGLAEGEADHHPAHQARTGGGGDGVRPEGVTPASAIARPAMASMVSTWARAAISGTTPP